MSISVNRVVGRRTDEGLTGEVDKYYMPDGFCVPVDDEGQIIQPIFFYLYQKCFRSAKVESVGHSQTAYCYDLVDWFLFLKSKKLQFDSIDIDTIADYRDEMCNGISPFTGMGYAKGTVKRRLSTVINFIKWLIKANYLENIFGEAPSKVTPRVNKGGTAFIDKRYTAATTAIERDLMPRNYTNAVVSFIEDKALTDIFNQLGSLPSNKEDGRLSRDRLLASFCFNTGVRIDEALEINVSHIKGLKFKTKDDFCTASVKITKTKRLNPRQIFIPRWFYIELMIYIEGVDPDEDKSNVKPKKEKPPSELELAIEHGRKNGVIYKSDSETPVFMNGVTCPNAYAGRRVGYKRYCDVFTGACIKLGLYTEKLTGFGALKVISDHSTHALRHKFAIVQYFMRKASGDKEPWKAIQVLLGHSLLTTTTDTYLKVVGQLEASTTTAMNDYHAYTRGVFNG